jgi:hypothetical protein
MEEKDVCHSTLRNIQDSILKKYEDSRSEENLIAGNKKVIRFEKSAFQYILKEAFYNVKVIITQEYVIDHKDIKLGQNVFFVQDKTTETIEVLFNNIKLGYIKNIKINKIINKYLYNDKYIIIGIINGFASKKEHINLQIAIYKRYDKDDFHCTCCG